MFKRLSLDEVSRFSDELGLDLSPDELAVMNDRMKELAYSFELFDDLNLDERPSLRETGHRDMGHRPSEEQDPHHAFIRVCRIEAGRSGELSGVRVALKDNIAVAGVPMTLGSKALEHYIPDFDSTLAIRLLDEGAVIVGKTNMDAFSLGGAGFGGVGEFGRPTNPAAPEHVTGGSSSGSAVAVASGAVDISFGGDQGGSIRLPASWCGVVGLKPTFGLIPHTGIFGSDHSVDHVGPLARSVTDLARVLTVVAGSDGLDPRQRDLPATLNYVDGLRPELSDITIGILQEGFGGGGSESDVDESVLAAISVLERLGARARSVSVPLHLQVPLATLPILSTGTRLTFETNFGGGLFVGFYPTSLIPEIAQIRAVRAHQLPLNIKLQLIAGEYLDRFYQSRLYSKAQNLRRTFLESYLRAFEDVDVLVMPTCPFKAPRYKPTTTAREAIERSIFGGDEGMDLATLTRNCVPFNYTGLPAMSIPCGRSSDGLPIGMQVVGRPFKDAEVLRVGYAFEVAQGGLAVS